MADRVYPSAKPNPPATNGNGAAANGVGGAAPAFPATKAQMYGANRMPYRPQPTAPGKRRPPRRSRCRCRCACCLGVFLLVVIALAFLIAIAGGVFYIIYRPHRPVFAVSSLRLDALNVSSAGALTSRLDLNITARNPNKKLVYLYDPYTVAISSNGIDIGDGSFPGFVQEAKNTTLLSATVAASSGTTLDSTATADLKKGSSLPVDIDLETKAGIKIGSFKTKRIGIKVHCEGIQVAVPKGKKAPAVSSPDSECQVKIRIKIWKWTI